MISYHKIYMSPVQSSNLQSQLCALWKKQKFCDAVIKSDNISVMAHRLVLSASCPVLQSIENYTCGSLLEIRVESDMTKESVMAFLQYLYEGYLMLTEENYSHVERLARSLHIDSVISCCKDFSQSIMSSRSNFHGPSDHPDFKHVRITNLLKVLDSSEKRPYEYADSDFSKRLKQSSFGNKDSSDYSSSESIAFTQKSQLCPAQYQNSQGEKTELRQGPCPTNQSMLYITPANTVPMAINAQKIATSGDGVIFFSNTKFNERSSTSLNSSDSLPVHTTGSINPLNARLIIPMIPNVHSLQTVQSSTFEQMKKTPQAEPYPVFLKEVPQPFSSLSGDSSGVNAGVDQNNEQLPMVSSQNSIEQLNIHQPTEKSNSQTHTSTSDSAASTDPSAEVNLSIVKVEPEDSIIQTDEGMFLSTAQRDETQTNQSSWLHDNPSMSSEENSGHEEMSSSSVSKTDQTTQDQPTSHRFQKLSDKEVQEILEYDLQSKATKQNTKWGVKILQDWHTESFGVPLDMASVDEEELAKKLGRFYCEAKPQPDPKKRRPTVYHRNTMKGIRAAINRHLLAIGRSIDIVNDKAFKIANKGLTGLLKQRMITGAYPLPAHQEIIDDSDLQKMSAFLENAYLSPVNLRLAVWYVIVVHFVSKGIDFSYHLRLDSFDFKVDEEGETYACLKRERKLKNDQEGIHICEAMYDKRMYETGKRNCPVKLLKFFLDKTDPRASHLFNYCYKDAIIDPTICSLWYRDTTLKRRAFVDFLPDICKAAGCKRYTANCLRKTAVQAMIISQFKLRDVIYFSEHKYESSAHSCNREVSSSLNKSASETLPSKG